MRPADEWSLVETRFRPATALAFEGLFTLGSGYLHLRGSLEEHLSDAPQNTSYTRLPTDVTSERFPQTKAKWGTYVPGVVGPHPLLGPELINLPWLLGLTPSVDGERLDVERARIGRYRRELRLEAGTLRRELRWHTRRGKLVRVVFERFVSAVRPQLCCQRLTLRADTTAAVRIVAGLDADVRTNGHDHFTRVLLRRWGRAGIACRVWTNGQDVIDIACRLRAPPTGWDWQRSGRAAALEGSFRLAPGRPLVIEKRSAVATSQDRSRRTATDLLTETAGLSYEHLHAEHAECWRQRWESCDVQVVGDAPAQRALRVALYHLLRAHPGPGARVSIDPKGYAGEAYWGRYFWDADIFLLPFYLYTDPARARTLVDFRVRTLAGAQANARRYGYHGARYAWESDPLGRECCPNWQYADHEVHVTADVVYGLAHYARATGDREYLRGPAAKVIVETARYWLERLDRRRGERHFSLLGVMGPDEYTPISNNNACTNRLVRFALELAAEVGASAGASAAERRAFARAARNLPIPRRADGLVLQCEDFEKLAEPDFARLWKDRTRTFGGQVSQERLYRSKCLKQADVLMLMLLFAHEFSDAEVRRAWDYYLPLTTHDSSLSPGVHALIACRLGQRTAAWRFWQRAAQIDLDVTRGGAAEGIHIANAALLWQAAVFGFAGVQTAMQSDVLASRPCLPPGWSELSFPLVWRGQRLRVTAGRTQVAISNRSAGPLRARVGDEEHRIGPGATAVWRLSTPRPRR